MTFCLVTLAWVFFRAGSMGEAYCVVKKIIFIPSEYGQFLTLSNQMGAKAAAKVMFAMTNSSFGFFKGIVKICCLVALLIVVEMVTKNKPGLEILRNRPIAIRWVIYFCVVNAIILFSQHSSYSTNFIYQKF